MTEKQAECNSADAGTRSSYYDYLQSEHWKKTAEETKKRADYRCQVCYSPDNLDTHHRTYARLGHELPTDVICLCHDCHEIFHFEDPQYTDEPLLPVVIFSGKSDSAWGEE